MIEVRKATYEDLDSLYQIYTHAAQFKHQFNDRSWRDGFTRDGVKWMIDQDTTYVAAIDDDLVGATALEWSDEGWEELEKDDSGYIRRLAVAEGHHGQGVGKAILDWALQETGNKNRKYLRLDCPQKNTSLCNYYENQGFKLIKTVKWPSDNNEETVANLYQKQA